MSTETALSGRLPSFHGGVHPPPAKEATAGQPIERFPFVSTYVLPLGQHLGAPSRPVVTPGQRVRRGQVLAEPGGWVSVALHAPVTGTVVALEPRRNPDGRLVPSVVVEADPFDPQVLEGTPVASPETLPLDEFARFVQRSGLVGLGGAAFPTHVKLKPPEGSRCQTFLVNGAECEPFLTCDHRVMVEQADRVVRGARLMARHLGAERTLIGIEANKLDAVEALRAADAASPSGPQDAPLSVVPLQVKYPQGAEKMLIRAVNGAIVPAGKLPVDVGVVVSNVGSVAMLADVFDRGWPLVERVVTVAGPGVRRPSNFRVPLGTSVREVLAHLGSVPQGPATVVMGGPMMGAALPSLDVPVLKGTSGILVFPASGPPPEYACVRCGRCLEACAYDLNPSTLGRLARRGRIDDMAEHHVMDCMECGACAYVCPSGIPLAQLFRMAKIQLRRRKTP